MLVTRSRPIPPSFSEGVLSVTEENTGKGKRGLVSYNAMERRAS